MRFLEVRFNDSNNNNKQIMKAELIIIIIMRFLEVWVGDDNDNNKQTLKVEFIIIIIIMRF